MGTSFYLKKCTYLTVLCMVLFACNKHKEEPYKFFVAGHTYGSPSDSSGGLHPPFLETLTEYNSSFPLEKGFLTGDIVKYPSVEKWEMVDEELADLDIDVRFVAGNHEYNDLELFESRYGKTFNSFVFKNDLFVVLDGNLNNWNISGVQLTFLKEALDSHTNAVENVFIFVHQIIFHDYLPVAANSDEGKGSPLTYETEVKPLLESLDNPVYLFAGDIGAFDWGPSLYHNQVNNVTYIASGMGSGLEDNFLVVEVDSRKRVSFTVVSLNEEDLGELESY